MNLKITHLTHAPNHQNQKMQKFRNYNRIIISTTQVVVYMCACIYMYEPTELHL